MKGRLPPRTLKKSQIASDLLVDHPFSITAFYLCTYQFDAPIFRLVDIFLHLPCSLLLSTPAPASQQQGTVFQSHQHRQAKNGWCQQRSRTLIFPLGVFNLFLQALHTSVVRLSSRLPQGLNAQVPVVPNSTECWREINFKAGGQCFSFCPCSGDFCHRGLHCQTNF